MTKSKMKNYNRILTEKQQKFQHCHQVKPAVMNISLVKKYYLLIKQKKTIQGQGRKQEKIPRTLQALNKK